MATTDLHFIAGALQPVKRGIRFLGATTAIQIDASVAAIVAANHTIGTITAWIMVPNNTGTYGIISFGDSAANVEYVDVSVVAGKIHFITRITTPTTTLDVLTPANSIKPHTWHHVAIVQDASYLKIYIDGVIQTLTMTNWTVPGQWFENMNAIDGAHIGASDSLAGGGGLTQHFLGYIADVRIWSGTVSTGALSELQVKRVMNGEVVGAAFNSWSLDSTLVDTGTGADNGTGAGDIIYSDANEFASRLTFVETAPLAADQVAILADGGVGYAYSILAA